MIYGNRQDKIDHIQKRIDAIRKLLKVYPAVREIIRSFDNKVYNCKLDKALEAVKTDGSRRVICNTRYDNNWIYMWTWIDNYDFTLLSFRKDQLKDGKRIDAAQWLELLEASRAAYLKEINQMQQDIENIDQIIKQLDILKKQAGTIIDSLSSTTRDVFGINRIYNF